MVLSLCNEKGGCSKTTITINLATKLALIGEDTLLIDADPQQSVKVFTDIRARENIDFIFSTVSKLGSSLVKEVQKLKSKYDAIVMDTGGRDSEEMRQALAISDLVIIPVVPSDVDIAVLNKMINLFNQSKAFNPNSKAFIVISKASPNPFLNKKIEELQNYIKDKNLEDFKLCETILYEREAYKNAFSNGKGILEYLKEDEKAYIEFNKFFDELVDYANS